MKHYLSLFFLLASLLLSVAACSDDQPQPPVVVPDPDEPGVPEEARVAVSLTGGIVRPSSAVSTRSIVSGVWTEGDSIGLYLFAPGTQTPVDDNANRHYVALSGGETVDFGPATPADTAYYPKGDASSADLLAYYPYSPALAADGSLLLPVDVAAQADVMTARATADRHHPAARLDFHHRLTRLMFSLSGGTNVSQSMLRGARLTLHGMHTHGVCRLADGSVTATGEPEDIHVPLNAEGTQGELLVLPRAAAPGVELRVTLANGDVYTARMKADTPLEPETANLFRIDLDHLYTDPVNVELGATVAPWSAGIDEALTASLVEMNVYPAPDATTGFASGDEVTVWASSGSPDTGNPDSEEGAAYTFDGNRWSSPAPFYWDELDGNTTTFSARFLPAERPEGNRMPDLLVASADVQRYYPVNLEFGHAMSQLIVVLKAGTDMTQEEVNGATVTIPQALVGYTLDGIVLTPTAETGTVTLAGTGDRRTALLLPQTITGQLLGIVIGGQEYSVKATAVSGVFAAGQSNTLTVTVNKTAVSFSFRIGEWGEGYSEDGDAGMEIK